MKIAIFCSANQSIDPDFFSFTQELGTWIATHGHALVFGGANLGLMECVAKAVFEAGGQTIGIVPSLLLEGEAVSEYTQVVIPCDNLSDRKDIMLAQCDVVIALPGGIGTLDEIFTIAASATIGYHCKHVILYNMKGFWGSLVALLDDLSAKGMVRGRWQDYIGVANNLEEITEALSLDKASSQT
ncbi:MAG: TIGR00730 family Rossman fold protein [Prevotella sp.]|nr:TIGR00730 family Rossman fold protein [Prevotella sp.]